jgi:hypothetical protein
MRAIVERLPMRDPADMSAHLPQEGLILRALLRSSARPKVMAA